MSNVRIDKSDIRQLLVILVLDWYYTDNCDVLC